MQAAAGQPTCLPTCQACWQCSAQLNRPSHQLTQHRSAYCPTKHKVGVGQRLALPASPLARVLQTHRRHAEGAMLVACSTPPLHTHCVSHTGLSHRTHTVSLTHALCLSHRTRATSEGSQRRVEREERLCSIPLPARSPFLQKGSSPGRPTNGHRPPAHPPTCAWAARGAYLKVVHGLSLAISASFSSASVRAWLVPAANALILAHAQRSSTCAMARGHSRPQPARRHGGCSVSPALSAPAAPQLWLWSTAAGARAGSAAGASAKTTLPASAWAAEALGAAPACVAEQGV